MQADITGVCIARKIPLQLPTEMQDFEKYL